VPPFFPEGNYRKRSLGVYLQAVEVCPRLTYRAEDLRNLVDVFYAGDYGLTPQAMKERFIERAHEKRGTQR
jgi:hypothetical protein